MRFRLYMSFLKTVSSKRIANFVLIELSYRLSALFRKNWHLGMPYSLSVEPTTSCNLQCPQCPSGLRKFSRPRGNLSMDMLKKVLDQAGSYLMYITFYFQGEPFINKDFLNMVKEARRRKIFVATSTNAHYIDRNKALEIVHSGLNKLIISLDGTDQESYEKYRKGGSLDRVLQAIEYLVEAKKQQASAFPLLELQFLVFRHNAHQIDEVRRLAKDLGVDKLSLKSAQVYEFEEESNFIPESTKYSRYEKGSDGMYRIKSVLPNRCHRMWSSCVITWDGGVVPCCFDKDANHRMGTLDKEKLRDVWKSKEYHRFRQSILSDRKQNEICRNCSEGLR